jgi:TRAP-type C4-dicarboxylate transport system permease small subunit
MVIAILLQIFGRYMSNDMDISWTEESARFAQIWMVFFGAGIAMQRNLHVGVDVLTAVLKGTSRKILLWVCGILAVIFLVVTIYGSFDLIAVGGLQISAALNMPMSYVYFIIPIGLFYWLVEYVIFVAKQLKSTTDLEAKE